MNGSSSFKPSGSVTSRFVSQTDLEEAQKKREEEVRATYARLGQSPPPEALAAARREADGTTYDPRSLYERLKANKDAKQEAIDEKLKLGNQFRGIDDSESVFLAQIAKQKIEAERLKERETRDELERFRKATLTKEAPSPTLPAKTATVPITASSATNKGKSAKRKREGLLGVVKKKKTQSEEKKDSAEKNKEENKVG